MRLKEWLFLTVMVCVFLFVGCAATRAAVDNYNACKNDDTCMQQMVANGDLAVQLVKTTDCKNWFELIAFNLVSGLSGVLLGSKLKKKGC